MINNLNLGIQVLRGLCCMGIVVAHSCAYAEEIYKISEISLWCRYGMLGSVCFFFIMSSYLVVKKLDSGESSFLGFIKGRFWGIYPIYWLCVITVILYTLCTSHVFMVSSRFWRSLLLIPGDTSFVCGVEWTLWYEFTYYALICWFFISKIRKYFLFFFLLFFVLYIYKFDGTNVINNMVQIPFSNPFLAFFVGIFIYFIEKFLKLTSLKSIINNLYSCKSPQIICGISFCLSLIFLDIRYFSANTWLHKFIIFIIVTLCFFVFKTINVNNIYINILVDIGNASYGIYLLHPTLLRSSFNILNHLCLPYSVLLHILVVISSFTLCFMLASFYKALVKLLHKYFHEFDLKKVLISRYK